jgi:ATP-binding cassette subfamily B protein
MGRYHPTLEVIRYVGRGIILVYGGYLVASGQIAGKGVGGIVQAYLYWDWFMNPIIFLGNFYNQLMMAMAGAERVFALLETEPGVQDEPNAKPLPRIEGRVRFENVTFGYNPERPVLHDVNFEARPGQMFALVGHTGSGKSSIVSLIARFYQPQQGRVLVDEQDIRHVVGESLHRQMGLVLQQNYLFTGTVLDNIRYAKPDATEAQVLAAARDLGTLDAILSLKDGLQTDVGERGANMSLGQRQLICFTRAYLADPRIFMLDEATRNRSNACSKAGPRSSSPTGSARSCAPTASWSSIKATSSSAARTTNCSPKAASTHTFTSSSPPTALRTDVAPVRRFATCRAPGCNVRTESVQFSAARGPTIRFAAASTTT